MNIEVFNNVSILFIIMCIGFFVRKANIITKDTSKNLSEFMLYISLPFLIIKSFQFDYSIEKLKSAGFFFLISLAIHGFSILFAIIAFRKFDNPTKSILKLSTVFTNCAYMGYPILDSLFHSDGIFYGAIYGMVFNILIWTYGIFVFSNKKEDITYRKALLNPGIISVCIGLLLFIFSIKLPFIILKPLDMVGSMTTPISMLVIGGLITESNLNSIFSGLKLYIAVFVRLIFLPLLVFFIMKIFKIESLLINIAVLLTAMPAAASTAIFAEKHGGDSLFASRTVAFSTILSVITIPAIIFITNFLR